MPSNRRAASQRDTRRAGSYHRLLGDAGRTLVSVLPSASDDFESFQSLAIYLAGHPRLGAALRDLKALPDDEFSKQAAQPYEFLAGYGIAISTAARVEFERRNPTCVTLFFLFYSIRICAF